MIALGLLAVFALCGARCVYLDQTADTSRERDRAAPWGIAASFAFIASVVALAIGAIV